MNTKPVESQADVSVIIPTRDRPELCSQAVRSALAQTAAPLEVIVVDDGSTDAAAIRRAVQIDARVQLVRADVSGGPAAARNRGIDRASAPWLAFLDDDDLWAPGKLAAQLELADQRSLEFVYTDFALIDLNREVVRLSEHPDPDELKRQIRRLCPLQAGTSTVMVRTELVQRNGGFDERFRHLEDWELWLRLVPGAAIGRCPQTLVGRTEDARNMQSARTRDVRRELRQIVQLHRLDEGYPRLDRAHFTEYLTAWQRRSGRRGQASLGYLRLAWERRSFAELGRAVGVLAGERYMAGARRVAGRSSEGEQPVRRSWWELAGTEGQTAQPSR